MKNETTRVSWVWALLCIGCMTMVPLWMYWSFICIEFHHGNLHLPRSFEWVELKRFWHQELVEPVLRHAVPTLRTAALYAIWNAWQAVLFVYLPGPVGEGVVLSDGTRLKYKYNGQMAFLVTNLVVALLHWTGVFRLTELYSLFPQLLTLSLLWTSFLCATLYVKAVALPSGGQSRERLTNSVVYNYFMGCELNPRIGSFDIKFFFEIRPGIMLWWFITVGLALTQYEQTGTICTPMILIVFYHLCFVNACYKGEQCVPMTMDIVYEKFGWMLMMLDVVMVPCVFPLQTYYLLKKGPFEHSFVYTFILAAMHIVGYWIFDTANSQKDYFREKDPIPRGFPRLPWDELHNPRYIKTERGRALLVDGWWSYARHMNYLGDLMMCFSWGLTCGLESYFPFTYATYLLPLLLHRERRDDRDCQNKYGKDWDRYKEAVPWRILPYVY